MKTLSDFKRILSSCLVHKLNIKSTVTNKEGEIVKENPFAPVCHVQSNSFAVLRNEKFSWAEYGKASEWEFKDNKAIRYFSTGGFILFEIEAREFFGL